MRAVRACARFALARGSRFAQVRGKFPLHTPSGRFGDRGPVGLLVTGAGAQQGYAVPGSETAGSVERDQYGGAQYDRCLAAADQGDHVHWERQGRDDPDCGVQELASAPYRGDFAQLLA
ncbi:hypothetical protein ADK76_14640 [Streptomyces griseoflavus]|nr:hypothetical protein ADK76_14640 [Streptomyces griseoflavus]